VWALAPEEIGEFIANLHEPHARGWLFAVLKDLPREASIWVLVTLWALWHARRKIIHEGQFQSPLSTHHFVERFISELGKLAPVPVSKLVRSAPGPKWIAPPMGFDKVNVDAAASKNSAMGAIAAVA
jgi:hypothetical protein